MRKCADWPCNSIATTGRIRPFCTAIGTKLASTLPGTCARRVGPSVARLPPGGAVEQTQDGRVSTHVHFPLRASRSHSRSNANPANPHPIDCPLNQAPILGVLDEAAQIG